MTNLSISGLPIFHYLCISHIFQIPIYRIKFPVFWSSVSLPLKWQESDRCVEECMLSIPLRPIELHPYIFQPLTYSQVRLDRVSFLSYWGKSTGSGVRVCLLEAGLSAHSLMAQETWDTSHLAAAWVHDCFTDFPSVEHPKVYIGEERAVTEVRLGRWWSCILHCTFTSNEAHT